MRRSPGEPAPAVHRGGLADSTRWQHVTLRAGDIVISTPSKCGTTWLQLICALLVLRTPHLPAPLTALSPWVDMRLRPIDEVTAVLDTQRHRRFLKTHTPLDGLPRHPGVTYLVAGRDPCDVAVSMAHHRANLNSEVISRLLGADTDAAPPSRAPGLRDRVLQWIHEPGPTLDSLRGLVHHLGQAWDQRADPSVILLHHADLVRDLPGRLHDLAGRLDLPAPDGPLIEAAGFPAMRANASALVPDERLGLFTDRNAFFRSGRAGQWRDLLDEDDLAGYDRLLRSLAPPDLVRWLEHGQLGG